MLKKIFGLVRLIFVITLAFVYFQPITTGDTSTCTSEGQIPTSTSPCCPGYTQNPTTKACCPIGSSTNIYLPGQLCPLSTCTPAITNPATGQVITPGCCICMQEMSNVYYQMVIANNPQKCKDTCVSACRSQYPSSGPYAPINIMFLQPACIKHCYDTCGSQGYVQNFINAVTTGPLGFCQQVGCSDCANLLSQQTMGESCGACLLSCNYKNIGAYNKAITCMQGCCPANAVVDPTTGQCGCPKGQNCTGIDFSGCMPNPDTPGTCMASTDCTNKCIPLLPENCLDYCLKYGCGCNAQGQPEPGQTGHCVPPVQGQPCTDCGIPQTCLSCCDQKYPCSSSFSECFYSSGSCPPNATSLSQCTSKCSDYPHASCNCQPSADSCFQNYLCRVSCLSSTGSCAGGASNPCVGTSGGGPRRPGGSTTQVQTAPIQQTSTQKRR